MNAPLTTVFNTGDYVYNHYHQWKNARGRVESYFLDQVQGKIFYKLNGIDEPQREDMLTLSISKEELDSLKQ